MHHFSRPSTSSFSSCYHTQRKIQNILHSHTSFDRLEHTTIDTLSVYHSFSDFVLAAQTSIPSLSIYSWSSRTFSTLMSSSSTSRKQTGSDADLSPPGPASRSRPYISSESSVDPFSQVEAPRGGLQAEQHEIKLREILDESDGLRWIQTGEETDAYTIKEVCQRLNTTKPPSPVLYDGPLLVYQMNANYTFYERKVLFSDEEPEDSYIGENIHAGEANYIPNIWRGQGKWNVPPVRGQTLWWCFEYAVLKRLDMIWSKEVEQGLHRKEQSRMEGKGKWLSLRMNEIAKANKWPLETMGRKEYTEAMCRIKTKDMDDPARKDVINEILENVHV